MYIPQNPPQGGDAALSRWAIEELRRVSSALRPDVEIPGTLLGSYEWTGTNLNPGLPPGEMRTNVAASASVTDTRMDAVTREGRNLIIYLGTLGPGDLVLIQPVEARGTDQFALYELTQSLTLDGDDIRFSGLLYDADASTDFTFETGAAYDWYIGAGGGGGPAQAYTAFLARLSNPVTLPNFAFTPVPYGAGNIAYNYGQGYDGGTSLFTAQQDGLHMFSGVTFALDATLADGTIVGTRFDSSRYGGLNVSLLAIGRQQDAATGYAVFSGQVIVDMTAGDTIGVSIRQGGNAPSVTISASTQSYFTGGLVAAR